MKTKTCARCQQEKPLEDFHRSRSIKDGRHSYCRACMTEKRGQTPRGINHGQSRTRLYRIWKAMRERCYNPQADNYRWYGGKGNGYEDGLQLDRRYADLDYGPDNCRWITKRENIKRARTVIPLELEDELAAYAEAHGLTRTQVIEVALLALFEREGVR